MKRSLHYFDFFWVAQNLTIIIIVSRIIVPVQTGRYIKYSVRFLLRPVQYDFWLDFTIEPLYFLNNVSTGELHRRFDRENSKSAGLNAAMGNCFAVNLQLITRLRDKSKLIRGFPVTRALRCNRSPANARNRN